MAIAYSTRLFAGQVLSASGRMLAFTVPAGYRIVVRYISASGAYVAGNGLILYLGSGGSELTRVEMASGTSVIQSDARVVYHEGEACYVRSLAGNPVVSLHGFQLVGSGGPISISTLPA